MYQIKIRNTVKQQEYDEVNEVIVDRDAGVIAAEEQALIDARVAEIQPKVDAYIAAQQYQLQNGGPGPVADEEIVAIVNEHNGQFEVVFKEAGE